MRRTTKRPLPCPHCYRPISAERLNSHIEEEHGTSHTTTYLMQQPKKEDLHGIWKAGSRAKKAEDYVHRRAGNAPACYLCGESLGNMTLKEHFETCDGRPTLNDETQLKKVRTRTIDYNDLSLKTGLNNKMLTDTGHVGTDYNNIKAIKYPDKEVLRSPPQTDYKAKTILSPERNKIIVEHANAPRFLTTSQYGTAPRYVQYGDHDTVLVDAAAPRYIVDNGDRNLTVKQITFPNGVTENINANSLSNDWKIEPYTVLGSSFAQRKQSLRRLPRAVGRSMTNLPIIEDQNEIKVVSINGRVTNHKGTQSYKKLRDPYRYENVSLINAPTRTIINEVVDTRKPYRFGTTSSVLSTVDNGETQLLGFGQPDTSGGFIQRGNTITAHKPLNSEKPVYAIYEQNPYDQDVYQVEPIYKTMDRSILVNQRGALLPQVTQVVSQPGITQVYSPQLPSVTQVVTQVKPTSSYSFSRDNEGGTKDELDWEKPFKDSKYQSVLKSASTTKFKPLKGNSYTGTKYD